MYRKKEAFLWKEIAQKQNAEARFSYCKTFLSSRIQHLFYFRTGQVQCIVNARMRKGRENLTSEKNSSQLFDNFSKPKIQKKRAGICKKKARREQGLNFQLWTESKSL